MAGQAIGAVAQPFFGNTPAKISVEWFPQEQRGTHQLCFGIFFLLLTFTLCLCLCAYCLQPLVLR